MTQKQKKMLVRICLSAVLLAGAVWGVEQDLFRVTPKFLMFLFPYLVIGWDIVYKALREIGNGQVFDENFLMTIATFGAFAIGEYTEAAAVMLFYQIGELFQDYAVNRSRQSIAALMDICPEYANVEVDGEMKQIDPDEVEVGTVIVIKAGERIPLDGVVVSGESMIDTSALTGESVPRLVKEGAAVLSGCVNGGGLLHVRTTSEFDDSTVARILELVENASSKKAKAENFITRFARYYTPAVVIAALALALFPPLLFGQPFGGWLKRACIFLVISCPCALVISVPLSFFGGIGAASGIGVLVKGSNYLEALAQLDTIVFDKTGTLTKGEFRVTEINPAKEQDKAVPEAEALFLADGKTEVSETKRELLRLAALAESYSNHPIAESIRAAWREQTETLDAQKSLEDGFKLEQVGKTEEISGHGVKTVIDGCEVLAGNDRLMEQFGITYQPCGGMGTVVYLAQDGVFAGSIRISDSLKKEAESAIWKLKKAGVKKTVMLTGDRKEAGEAAAEQLGLDEVYTELLPADKVAKVEELLAKKTAKGHLAFVGDGLNDAPVLSRADIGIAMGSMGADAAIEAADLVLMDDNPEKIAAVVGIARKTLTIVHQNIVFALAVKALVLLLGAAGAANMWEAVFADVGVAVLAILNAMRALKIEK